MSSPRALQLIRFPLNRTLNSWPISLSIGPELLTNIPGCFFLTSSETPEGYLTTPKTGKGRVIDITPHLKPFLQSWRHLKDVKNDLVFPRYRDDHLRKRVWTPALRKMGISYRKPYVTRHTFASLMLAEGQTPSWVANMMGDNLETVLRNYAQWIPTDYKTALMRPIDSGLDGHFLDTFENSERPLRKNTDISKAYGVRSTTLSGTFFGRRLIVFPNSPVSLRI